MTKTNRPTAQDAVEAKRIALAGLSRGDDVTDLARQLEPLHPKNDTCSASAPMRSTSPARPGTNHSLTKVSLAVS
jgi:hypothetical protein